MNLATRPFHDEADYAAMRALVVDIYALAGPPVYATVGDLDWWRATEDDPDAIGTAQLWWDASRLVGVAWPADDRVDLLVHPHYRMVEDDMLAWAEQRRGAPPRDLAQPLMVQAWGYDQDTARIELLWRRGYQRGDTSLVTLAMLLDTSVPEPLVPPGYTLRPVQGEADLERRVAVHRDAFAPSRMTIANHRRVMQAPTYRPQLDLVVVAPDESFAAFGIFWLDEQNRIGLVEPLGCHPHHRRRGLSRALLCAGLHRLVELDATMAYVTTGGSNDAARQLYESVGFRMAGQNYAWTKAV